MDKSLIFCGPNPARKVGKWEWGTIDTDLVHLLEGLRGGVERKLEKIGEIIYSYGRERLEVQCKDHSTQKELSAHLKSRRQQEIDRLVKERRHLRRQWKHCRTLSYRSGTERN